MRAILDPGSRPREFVERGASGIHFDSLPISDIRKYRPKALPKGVSAASPQLPPSLPPASASSASRLTRPQSRPRHLQPLKPEERAKRNQALWKSSIREWMRIHDVRSASRSWELPHEDEKVLFEWFDAIDVDRNGDVDADEIRALLAANKIGCSPARLEEIFNAAGKNLSQGLALHDFVRGMHSGGAAALFLPSYRPAASDAAQRHL